MNLADQRLFILGYFEELLKPTPHSSGSQSYRLLLLLSANYQT